MLKIFRIYFSVCGFQGTYVDKIQLLAERSKNFVFVAHGYAPHILIPSNPVNRLQVNLTRFPVCPNSAALRPYRRGDGGIRTLDPLLARQVLSQLSYTPMKSGSHLLSHIVSNIVPSAA